MTWIYMAIFAVVAVGVGVYLEHRISRCDTPKAAGLRSANRRDKGGGR